MSALVFQTVGPPRIRSLLSNKSTLHFWNRRTALWANPANIACKVILATLTINSYYLSVPQLLPRKNDKNYSKNNSAWYNDWDKKHKHRTSQKIITYHQNCALNHIRPSADKNSNQKTDERSERAHYYQLEMSMVQKDVKVRWYDHSGDSPIAS